MPHRNKPLVSIVIPSYNHSKYIKDTIRSVISQSYQNIELIIIDDGSRDNSVEIIESMIPECIKRFTSFTFITRANKGLCKTLNEGLEKIQGKYYSSLASDDIIYFNKIELQVNYLEEELLCDAVFGGIEVVDDSGKLLRTIKKPRKLYGFKDIIFNQSFLMSPTQLIRTSSIREMGGYPESCYIEDWYAWLKLTEKGSKLANLDIVFSKYRRHETNISSNLEKMDTARRQILEQYKDTSSYKDAISFADLLRATELQKIDKIKSLKYYIDSGMPSLKIIFSCNFLKYVIKFLIP